MEVSPNTDTLVQGDTLRLAVLLASENEPMGPIPPEFRNLTNLWNLQLDNNDLAGPVPR